jgi:hypothetical protein
MAAAAAAGSGSPLFNRFDSIIRVVWCGVAQQSTHLLRPGLSC